MMRISAGTASLIIVLIGQALAQTQRFPAFDPEQIFVLATLTSTAGSRSTSIASSSAASPRMKAAAASIEPLVPPARYRPRWIHLAARIPQEFSPTAGRCIGQIGGSDGEAAGCGCPAGRRGFAQDHPRSGKVLRNEDPPCPGGTMLQVPRKHRREVAGRASTRHAGWLRARAATPGRRSYPAIWRRVCSSAIRYTEKELRMPPKAKLPDQVVADFEAWVKMGAPDPRPMWQVPRLALRLILRKGGSSGRSGRQSSRSRLP